MSDQSGCSICRALAPRYEENGFKDKEDNILLLEDGALMLEESTTAPEFIGFYQEKKIRPLP